MTIFEQLSLLTTLDLAAAAFLLVSRVAVDWIIEHPPQSRPSVSTLMDRYRMEWLCEALQRDVRIFDSQIIANLRQGTAFFASMALFSLGGVLALIGNTDPLEGVASQLSEKVIPVLVWQVKLVGVALFLTHAFLRFAWANRMFGYASVLLASIPNDPAAPNARLRARQTADLAGRSTKNFNRGLRSIYFALGTLAWLIGPLPLMVVTAITVAFIVEREFMSGGRRTLLEEEMTDDPL